MRLGILETLMKELSVAVCASEDSMTTATMARTLMKDSDDIAPETEENK